MEKPDEKLFGYSNESRTYEYQKLNGEIGKHFISSDELLIDAKCPVCGNYLVMGCGYMDKWVECPECKMDTRRMSVEGYMALIVERICENVKNCKILADKMAKDAEIIKLLSERK